MEIYDFNNSFPIFRFNDFNNHVLDSISEYNKSLLFGIVGSNSIDAKLIENKIDINSVLSKVSRMENFHLLNNLLSLYPAISFLNDNKDISEILKNAFSKDLILTDWVLLKNVLNFKFDVEFLNGELDRISKVYGFEVNNKLIFKELFVTFYKYCFVLFCKSIDFKFGKGEYTEAKFERNFRFDFKKLERELNNKLNILKRSDIKASQYAQAKEYLNNYISSCKEDSIEKSLDILHEILEYNTPKKAERKIYYSISNNINFDEPTIKETKKFNSELRSLFLTIIKPLFHNSDNPELDKDKLRDIQKHLHNKK